MNARSSILTALVLIVEKTVTSLVVLGVLGCCAATATAQQRGQWLSGFGGLNAGVMAEPGFTYAVLTVRYSADSAKDETGATIPVEGTYSVWAVANLFSFVPNAKVLGGHYGVMVALIPANGSLTVPQYGIAGGGSGLGDLWVQPVMLGWHFDRVDVNGSYSFTAPTGRFTYGATDNIGSGYWGHWFTTGTTAYLTRNKAVSASLLTNYEIHGQMKGTNVTPGQTFTMEWGLGFMLPLDKELKKLLQLGLIGYDQWQVSDSGGEYPPLGVPANLIPHYSVHGVGFQANFVVPAKALSFFLKYEPEYGARAHSQGHTLVVGGAWTLRIPKAKPPS